MCADVEKKTLSTQDPKESGSVLNQATKDSGAIFIGVKVRKKT